jgi:lantibiotic biosynthesis protein
MNSLVCDETEIIYESEIDDYLQKIDKILEQRQYENDTLFSGNLGRVLYFMYRYRTSDNLYFADLASSILGQVLENIREKKSRISFTSSISSGLTGLCFINMLLEDDDFMDLGMNKTFIQFDEIIFKKACQQIKEGNLDYLHGALGSLYYFSFRVQKNENIAFYITQMIDLIMEGTVNKPNGMYFKNVWINQMNETPNSINFGFAHGLTGMVMVLLKIYQTGIANDKVRKIMNGFIEFILSKYQETDFRNKQYSHFPTAIAENDFINNSQNQGRYSSFLGWCYGDLNQAIMCYQAGKILDRNDLTRIAESISHTTLKRIQHKVAFMDNHFFCHGTSGLAQMYCALEQISGNTLYQEGSQYWLSQTMHYLEKFDWNTNTNRGLLGDLEGLGLVLMSVQSSTKTRWDRLFLLQ